MILVVFNCILDDIEQDKFEHDPVSSHTQALWNGDTAQDLYIPFFNRLLERIEDLLYMV